MKDRAQPRIDSINVGSNWHKGKDTGTYFIKIGDSMFYDIFCKFLSE